MNKNNSAVGPQVSDSPALPGQHFLRLWVMHQNVKQVLLLQDKEVSEAVGFDVSCPPVSSIFGRLQQTENKT